MALPLAAITEHKNQVAQKKRSRQKLVKAAWEENV